MGGLIALAIYINNKENIVIRDSLKQTSLWDYKVIDIDGNEILLGQLAKGKKAVCFVNVATKWGFTEKQYRGLIQLHQKYKE